MSRFVRQLRILRSAENGFALVMALSVMLITVVLVAVAATAAINTNSLSNRDSGLKGAVEAADAGARAAVYRLNEFRPAANYCPTEPTAPLVGSVGQ